MATKLQKLDKKILKEAHSHAEGIARLALFIVFFWFGLLKVLMVSPAFGLVSELQDITLPFFSNETFVVILGLAEMFIGLGFIFTQLTRVSILLMVLHMITTMLPLIMLPDIAWQGFLTPTLEGQYIIKNIVLVALALQIGVHLRPMKHGLFHDKCKH